MAVWHGRRGRKLTGGEITIHRKKRRFELGSMPLHTKIGKERKKIVKGKGGVEKVKAYAVEFANVLDPSTKISKKVKILHVLDHPDNLHFTRSGIITKGCTIKTEIGNARVTSRPSQHGVVNAIILEKEKT